MGKIWFNGVAYTKCYANGTEVRSINFTDAEGTTTQPFINDTTVSVAIKDSRINKATLTIKGGDSWSISSTSQVLSKAINSEKLYNITCTFSGDTDNYFPVIHKTSGDKTVWQPLALPTTVSTAFIKAEESAHYDCTVLPKTKSAVITAGTDEEPDPSGSGSYQYSFVNIKNPNAFAVTIASGTIEFYENGVCSGGVDLSGTKISANNSKLVSVRLTNQRASSTGIVASDVVLRNTAYGNIMNIDSEAVSLEWGVIEPESTSESDDEDTR